MSASREGAPESGHQQIFSLEESSHEAEQLAQAGPSYHTAGSHMGVRQHDQPQIPVPHPPLRVKRPGRPRIHPPKPAGISKPRGRPRGSKNKKPRKQSIERPPKRPRGRPRKWPREMWEGFQRSMPSHQMQPQQPHQDMPGPSHLYYEEQMPLHHHTPEESAPPLSHLPLHLMQQQEPGQLSHQSTSHMGAPPPPQHLPQMLQQHPEVHQQHMLMQQQQPYHPMQQHIYQHGEYYQQEQPPPPPHTTS